MWIAENKTFSNYTTFYYIKISGRSFYETTEGGLFPPSVLYMYDYLINQAYAVLRLSRFLKPIASTKPMQSSAAAM
jgi:hypothetical protein